MPSATVSAFGEQLVRFVRDRAIANCRARLGGQASSAIATRWKDVIANPDAKAISEVIVADSVDEAIFCLLNAIDSGDLKLSYHSSDGRTSDLTAEGLGELAGWYAGSDNWRDQYSTEKSTDYLKS